MRFGKLVLQLTVVVALSAPNTSLAADVRKLKEADVLKLVELQIRDDAIVERIEKSGVAFKIDDAVLERLRTAGASESVLDALRNTDPAAKTKSAELPSRTLMLWVEQYYEKDCPLQSEVSINDHVIDQFSSNAHKSIDGRLMPGWNKVVVKTTVHGPEANWNKLTFRIGRVQKDPKSKKQVMDVVLWKFDNGTDWEHKAGRYSHRIGPDVREVTTTYNLFLASPDLEQFKVKEGDYILSGTMYYDHNSPVSATVYVNGTPLTSFLGQNRDQVVISSLLKAGKNEIRFVGQRVPNVIGWNDIDFHIGGPAEYSAAQSKYVLSPILQSKTITGWEQDKKSGQWHNSAKPDSETLERTLTFNLDKAPKTKN